MLEKFNFQSWSYMMVKKLHARSAGLFQILKKLNDNVYVINFSKNFGISSTMILILTLATH